MAASTIIVPMAHERKVENLRAYMVNLANSKGLLLPETRLFEQKFLDLCLSRTPDHPTYSAMILIAITDLNEEGGSCEEAISELIKSKYKNLPFAHTSLLTHHLAKLVEKREILCDSNNYRYTLPGENKSASSTDAERNSLVITLKTNDQCAADEAMTLQNVEGSVEILKSGNHKVDMLEERSLTESGFSPKRKACGGVNVAEVSDSEVNGAKACLRDSTVEKSGSEDRIEANSEGGNDVLMEESREGEEKLREINLEQGKAKLQRISNTMKEACVEVKSVAYKTLWESQTEACSNIIALEKMLKQCREKDQQKKAVSEVDNVSCLPLSMESCEELRKFAQKIESQLSEIIGSFDEAVVPCYESRGYEIEGGSFHEAPTKRKTPSGNNGFGETSEQLEKKEREIDSQKKPPAKKARVRRLQDIGKTGVRKSHRIHNKPI